VVRLRSRRWAQRPFGGQTLVIAPHVLTYPFVPIGRRSSGSLTPAERTRGTRDEARGPYIGNSSLTACASWRHRNSSRRVDSYRWLSPSPLWSAMRLLTVAQVVSLLPTVTFSVR
jgi:hypothetical protein